MSARALIVYESMFGNTERIAWAVRDGLREYVEAETVRRQPRPQLPSPLDLLERRFAAGEITQEVFNDARARLGEHQLDL